jgi:hypothetical protein
MIEELLTTIETRANHDTNGINALIDSHNSDKSKDIARVKTIDVWALNKLPSQMIGDMPAFWIEWNHSPILHPISQGKWKGEHVIRFWYWINATSTRQNRKHLTGMLHVIRLFIDGLTDEDDAVEAMNVHADVFGFRAGPDQLFAALRVTATITEREENP